jgi:hypothetical protein
MRQRAGTSPEPFFFLFLLFLFSFRTRSSLVNVFPAALNMPCTNSSISAVYPLSISNTYVGHHRSKRLGRRLYCRALRLPGILDNQECLVRLRHGCSWTSLERRQERILAHACASVTWLIAKVPYDSGNNDDGLGKVAATLLISLHP